MYFYADLDLVRQSVWMAPAIHYIHNTLWEANASYTLSIDEITRDSIKLFVISNYWKNTWAIVDCKMYIIVFYNWINIWDNSSQKSQPNGSRKM